MEENSVWWSIIEKNHWEKSLNWCCKTIFIIKATEFIQSSNTQQSQAEQTNKQIKTKAHDWDIADFISNLKSFRVAQSWNQQYTAFC